MWSERYFYSKQPIKAYYITRKYVLYNVIEAASQWKNRLCVSGYIYYDLSDKKNTKN